MKELNAILKMVTGKGIDDIAADMIAGKSEGQMLMEVAEHVRRDTENSDPFKNALNEMLAEPQSGNR